MGMTAPHRRQDVPAEPLRRRTDDSPTAGTHRSLRRGRFLDRRRPVGDGALLLRPLPRGVPPEDRASPSLPKAPAIRTGPPGGIFRGKASTNTSARYCDAVHRHKPGVLVCSNWLQTLHDPGEPKVPTDWISGDNTAVWGLDNCRCEARFISTRGKPWDIMMWCFYSLARSIRPDRLGDEAGRDAPAGGGGHRGPGRQRADVRVSLRRDPHAAN